MISQPSSGWHGSYGSVLEEVEESTANRELGQRFLKVAYSGVGHLRVFDGQRAEPGQFPQMHQAGVAGRCMK
jgi:hypothetical protein